MALYREIEKLLHVLKKIPETLQANLCDSCQRGGEAEDEAKQYLCVKKNNATCALNVSNVTSSQKS